MYRIVPVRLQPRGAMSDLDLQERTFNRTVNITTASTLVMIANKSRTAAWLVNDSDVTIYVALLNEAALNTGIRLNANGGSFEINTTNLYKGPIYAIHGGTGNKVLCSTELESRYANI